MHAKYKVKTPVTSPDELVRLIFMLDSYDEPHAFSTVYKNLPAYAVYVSERRRWEIGLQNYVNGQAFTELSIEELAYAFDHDMFIKNMNFRDIATVIYTYDGYVQVCATKRWPIMSFKDFTEIMERYGAIAAYMDNDTFLFDRLPVARKYKTLVSINELLRVAKVHEYFKTEDGEYIYDGDIYFIVADGAVLKHNSVQYAKTTDNKCFAKKKNADNYLIGIWGTIRG